MSPDEQTLLREVGEFYDANHKQLFGFLRRMSLNLIDAEDVHNDCFLVVWQHWHALRDSNPRAYLYTVARNQLAKRWNKRARNPEDLVGDQLDEPAITSTGSEVINVDFAQQVVDRETMRGTLREALQKLTVREREAVLLRYYVECDVSDTAQIMGIKKGTVKRYSSDGLDKLYRALTGGEPSTREEGA
jgi:RNA polymerase sigma factor (sigma-70 family)